MVDGGVRATLLALFSAIGAFLFGVDIGYIAAIIQCASFKRDVGHLSNWQDPESSIDSTTTGAIVGIFSLGAVLACLPPCTAFCLDTVGRRPSITYGTAIFLLGCVLQAEAASVAQFMMGRFIAGISIGLLSVAVACYQVELAPPGSRGTLTSLYQLMITLGIFVATWLNYNLVGRDGGWRVAIICQALPAACLMIGTAFMPRSPRWLVLKGRNEEALDVLCSLRSNSEEANFELQQIVNSVSTANALGEPRWSELCEGRLGGMLAIGVGMQLLQQFCGMNAFMYFGPTIFQNANLDPVFFQTLNAGVNFLATFPALILIDTFGRRTLLISGAVGMLVSCLMMGSMSFFQSEKQVGLGQNTADPGIGSYVICTMSFCFVISFAHSWGPVVWVYVAEMYPLRHRAKCLGITTTANWLGNYMIAQFTPIMLHAMGLSTFFVFAFFSGLCLLMALWMPETKGLLLERVGSLFDVKLGTKHLSIASMASCDKTTENSYGAADTRSEQRLRTASA